MIEVVYNKNGTEDNSVRLPKNIKQVGSGNSNQKIYIEDYVYSYIKDLKIDENNDAIARIGILLGETTKTEGGVYTFISGATEVFNANVQREKIVFTDETWNSIRGAISAYFPNKDILGWFLVSTVIKESDNYCLYKTHLNNFEGDDKLLFRVDPDQMSEDFYYEEKDGLKKTEGYVVYYERNDAMQAYMAQARGERHVDEATVDTATGRFRDIMNNKSQTSDKSKNQLSIMYSLSTFLVIVILIIGINTLNSYSKMDKLQDSLDNLNNVAESTVDANANANNETKPTTPVETMPGGVKETETPTEEPTTVKETEPPTEPPTDPPTEAPTDPPKTYDTYTVKAGDTLFGICQNYYGESSNALVQQIIDLNGLASSEVVEGDVLKMP